MLILSGFFSISISAADYVDNHKLTWIQTNNTSTVFKESVNTGEESLTLLDYLKGVLTNDFNGIVSSNSEVEDDDLRKSTNSAVNLSQDEKDYYLTNNNQTVFSHGMDFLTVSRIEMFDFHRAGGEYHNGWQYDKKYCYYLNLYYDLSSDVYNKSTRLKREEKHFLYVSFGMSYKETRLERSMDKMVNPLDIDQPYIIKYPFLETPSSARGTTIFHTKWEKDEPYNEDLDWMNDRRTDRVYAYTAKSPVMRIENTYTLAESTEHFRPEDYFTLQLTTGNIRTKVTSLYLFRKPESGGDYIPAGSFTRQINGTVSQDLTNSGDISLASIAGGSLIPGEYKMVVGVVDLFNKMYFFQPEHFVVDNNAPTFDNVRITPPEEGSSDVLVDKDDPVFMSWDKIEDEYTEYTNEADYIYIKLLGDAEDKAVTDPDFSDNFIIEDKRILFKNEGTLEISQIYVKDKAGNIADLEVIDTVRNFIFDKTLPVVTAFDNAKIYTAADIASPGVSDLSSTGIQILRIKTADGSIDTIIPAGLYTTVDEVSFYSTILDKIPLETDKQIVSDLYQLTDGIYYLKDPITETEESQLRMIYLNEKIINYEKRSSIDVQLNNLRGKTGDFFIICQMIDRCGNQSLKYTLPYKIADTDIPIIELKAGSTVLTDAVIPELNLSQKLSITITDTEFDRFDIKVTSAELPDSVNNLVDNGILSNSKSIDLITDSSADFETLTIDVTSYDKHGNSFNRSACFKLWNDSKSPLVDITTPGVNESGYNIDITDTSLIEYAALKIVDLTQGNNLPVDLSPVPYKTGNVWNEGDWQILDENKTIISQLQALEPGTAGVVFVADRWGNSNEITLSNNTFKKDDPLDVVFEINSKADLAAAYWELYGEILLKTSITLNEGEVLTIKTIVGKQTEVICDSVSAGYPVFIETTDGTLNLDTTYNDISFSGTGNGYTKWKGIRNIGGFINFTGTNIITINNAESALAYLNPQSDITLKGLQFLNCITGVHFIDESFNYSKLILNGIKGENLAYAVKFDMNPFDDIGSYSDYLTLNNCDFINISRAKVYWNAKDEN